MLLRTKIKASSNANCHVYEQNEIFNVFKNNVSPNKEPDCDDESKILYMIENTEKSEFCENTLFYISGYIVSKLVKSIQCKNCKECLIRTVTKLDHEFFCGYNEVSGPAAFMAFVNNGGLIIPSEPVFKIVQCCEKLFRGHVCKENSSTTVRINIAVTESSLHSVNIDVQFNTTQVLLVSLFTKPYDRSTLVPGSPTHKTLASQTTFWFLVHQFTKPSNIKHHSGSWFTNSQNLRNSTPVLGHPTHETKENNTNHDQQQPEFDTAPKTTFTTPLSRIDAFVNSSFVRTPTRTQGNHQASHDSTTCSINSLHCITVASHLAIHLIHEYHDDQLEQRQSIRDITESFTSATNKNNIRTLLQQHQTVGHLILFVSNS
eukprot:gene3870-4413_t